MFDSWKYRLDWTIFEVVPPCSMFGLDRRLGYNLCQLHAPPSINKEIPYRVGCFFLWSGDNMLFGLKMDSPIPPSMISKQRV